MGQEGRGEVAGRLHAVGAGARGGWGQSPWDCPPKPLAVRIGGVDDSVAVVVEAVGAARALLLLVGGNAAATGDLDITDDLTINGEGITNTFIDGADLDRVFHVLPGNIVEISGLTIQNGDIIGSSGGGIENTGTLTLLNVDISNNKSISSFEVQIENSS